MALNLFGKYKPLGSFQREFEALNLKIFPEKKITVWITIADYYPNIEISSDDSVSVSPSFIKGLSQYKTAKGLGKEEKYERALNYLAFMVYLVFLTSTKIKGSDLVYETSKVPTIKYLEETGLYSTGQAESSLMSMLRIIRNVPSHVRFKEGFFKINTM